MEKKIKDALEKKSSYKFMRKKMTFTRKLAKLKKEENSEKELVKLQKTETNTWKILKQVKKEKTPLN